MPKHPPSILSRPKYKPTCDSCQQEVAIVVSVGEPEQWDSRTAHLCRPCLMEAVEMMNRAEYTAKPE